MPWPRRSIFIWQLGPVLEAEGSVEAVVEKALGSGVAALFVKIAEGVFPYRNTEGEIGDVLADLARMCRQSGIELWGWHVPRCATADVAIHEASIVEGLGHRFALDGLIMNAEPGEKFFQGDVTAAEAYGLAMRKGADRLGKPLGICSLALPHSVPFWSERLERIAACADVSFPQLYYGATPSISGFLAETDAANARFELPTIPVGAAWVGDHGGCASPHDCAARAREFIDLCRERAVPAHAFWHWAAAPPEFWNALKMGRP